MNYMSIIYTICPVIISAIAYAAFAIVSRYLIKRSKLSDGVKKSLTLIFGWPIGTAIIGYGIVEFISLNALLLPEYATRANAIFILELAFLTASVGAASRIGKILVSTLKVQTGTDKLLSFGVYTLGLLGLFYVIFTSPISPGLASHAWQFVNFVTGIIATYMVAHVINIIMKRYSQAIEGKQPQLETTLTFGRRVIIGIVALIGVAAATFSAFPTAGGAIASLFVAAGFTSIVIGLAAQSSISNLIAGGVVSLSQPFKMGDAILYDSQYCYVEDIKLMNTTLKIWDGRRLVVPNKLFLDTPIINYSSVDPSKFVIVFVPVSPESDLDKAMEIMNNAALRHPDRFPMEGLPATVVMEITDSGLSLRLLSYAKDQSTAFQMERDLLYQIKKDFDKNGIKLAFPRREVALGNGYDDKLRIFMETMSRKTPEKSGGNAGKQ